MKKINRYDFVEGMGGVVIAKSLKQAVKKIAKFYKPQTVSEILETVKKADTENCFGDTLFVEVSKVTKKFDYRKSQFLWFCDI